MAPRRRAPSNQYNPQASHEPRAQPPIAPVTQEPKGPVEINKPTKKDNNDTDIYNNNNKIMTINMNKENNNRIPGKESLRQGGWEENACKTTQNNAMPQNTLHFKDTKLSTIFAQYKHMHWRTQTVIRNTAGQKGALRHRTALKTLGSMPPR